MKKISFKSPFGILLFVVLPLSIILMFSGIRLDLTKEKRYTLSEGTIKVLESIKKTGNGRCLFGRRFPGKL